MSHSEFDNKARDAFDEMNDQDIVKAIEARERVWQNVDTSPKKRKSYRGLIWFLIGLLLAWGALYLKENVFETKKSPDVLMAHAEDDKQWRAELQQIKNAMASLEKKYTSKSASLDSMGRENQKLLDRIEDLVLQTEKSDFAEVRVQYVTDTVYTTKVEKQIVELEKVLRDTVYIEVPVFQGEDELMSDVSDPLDSINDKPKKTDKKKKPASIQFNFSNTAKNK